MQNFNCTFCLLHGEGIQANGLLLFSDRRRLTFFYVADRRIDFRNLVKDLFRLYKTRIWLVANGSF